jgi:hypothetical protein
MRRRQFPGADVISTTIVRHRSRPGLTAALGTLAAGCGLAVAACSSASSASAVGAQLQQRIAAAQDPAGYFVQTTAAQVPARTA